MVRKQTLVAGLVVLALAYPIAILAERANESATSTRGGLITLYARDALSHTLCLAEGSYGTVISDAQVKNRCSDIDFDGYNRGNLSVGIEGTRTAAILDIGTEDELQQKYGFRKTVGGGQGFASIQVAQQKVYIASGNKRMVALSGAEALFGSTRPVASAPIRIGHIYLLRIIDKSDPAKELLAKLLVVSYTPGDLVTLRWQLL